MSLDELRAAWGAHKYGLDGDNRTCRCRQYGECSVWGVKRDAEALVRPLEAELARLRRIEARATDIARGSYEDRCDGGTERMKAAEEILAAGIP